MFWSIQPDLRNQQQLPGTKKMCGFYQKDGKYSNIPEGSSDLSLWDSVVEDTFSAPKLCWQEDLLLLLSPAIVCCSSCFPGCAELMETLISWVRHLGLICDKQFGTHRWYIQQTRVVGSPHHFHRPGLILQQCEVIYVSIQTCKTLGLQVSLASSKFDVQH